MADLSESDFQTAGQSAQSSAAPAQARTPLTVADFTPEAQAPPAPAPPSLMDRVAAGARGLNLSPQNLLLAGIVGATTGRPSPEILAKPISGTANDTIWAAQASARARILNAAGYGFQDAWGGRPLGLNPDDDAAMRKAGVLPDYTKGHASFMQSVNEAVIRPAAAAADLAWTGIPATLGAVQAGAEQTATEVEGAVKGQVGAALAEPFKAVGEIAGNVPYLAPEFEPSISVDRVAAARATSEAARVQTANAARGVGALGEGEAGYFEAQPITPENAQARVEAAKDAGIQPPPPQPPAPDIHALARRIDPDTFEQFDALAAARQTHQDTLARLGAEREASPEALAAKAEVNEVLGIEPGTVRSGDFAERIRAFAATAPDAELARLDAAMGRVETALSADTPEMTAARNNLLQADQAMRELAPEVSAAYRQAREMAPTLPEPTAAEAVQSPAVVAAERAGEPDAAAQMVAQSQAEGETVAAAGVGKEAEAEVAPPNVVGQEKEGEPQPAPTREGSPAPIQTAPPGQALSQARYGNLRAVEGTGETVERGVSVSGEERAVASGIDQAFGELPTYDRVSMAKQAKQAVNLLNEDPQGALDVAMGLKAPPKGLIPEHVFIAVENRALADGDFETIRRLNTQSRLTTAGTTMGQRIRSWGERDESSPGKAMLDVQRAREAEFSKSADLNAAKRQTVEEIKAEVRRAASKADAWESFLNSVRCDS